MPYSDSPKATNPLPNTTPYKVKFGSGANLMLGLWLVIAPFLLASSEPARWNDIIVGLLVTALAGSRLRKPSVNAKNRSWLNVGLGCWLIVAPFLLTYSTQAAIWNDVLVGVLIILFGAWSALSPGKPTGK